MSLRDGPERDIRSHYYYYYYYYYYYLKNSLAVYSSQDILEIVQDGGFFDARFFRDEKTDSFHHSVELLLVDRAVFLPPWIRLEYHWLVDSKTNNKMKKNH